MKPFTFNPAGSAIASLFAKWLPLYVAQRPMDDGEAESYQEPLCELEKAISRMPIATMHDFFLHHTTQTCMGSMAADYSVDATDAICALAMAEAKEVENIQALVDEHIEIAAKFGAVLSQHDYDSPEYAAAGGDELSSRCIETVFSIAEHPATSFEAVMLKGRYFAARRDRGDLSCDEAFAFVESFLDRPEGV